MNNYVTELTKQGLGDDLIARKACEFLANGNPAVFQLAVNLYELGVAQGVQRATRMLDKMFEEKMNNLKVTEKQ